MLTKITQYNGELPCGYKLYADLCEGLALIIDEYGNDIMAVHVYNQKGIDEVVTKAGWHWERRCANGRNPNGLPHYEPFGDAPYLRTGRHPEVTIV